MSAAPLDGLVVLDFAQYLAGPSAALRMSDLGARVVKVERPGTGDGCRVLELRGQTLAGDSLLFHTINRGKASVTADLDDPADFQGLVDLMPQIDVLLHSFRPGALERRGLGYRHVREMNPRLVYGEVSGFGDSGPWAADPGQDLLVQARSGLTWTSGRAGDPPTPTSLSVIDTLAGAQLVQGVLACLVRRAVTGVGGLVQVSLLEAAMDLQFEVFTAFLNGGGVPERSALSAAHPYNAAPYGVYATADGWLALAMGPLARVGELTGLDHLEETGAASPWAERRDLVKRRLSDRLPSRTTRAWLDALSPAGVWCAEVLDWPALVAAGALQSLDLLVEAGDTGRGFRTTGCPIRIDGHRTTAAGAGPRLGELGSASWWASQPGAPLESRPEGTPR